jgi:hypothetical protein
MDAVRKRAASERKGGMKKTSRLFPLLLFIGLAACATPTPGPGPTHTDILDPLMNQEIPLAPYTIKFDSTALMGIDYFQVSVNGAVLAAPPPISTGSCGSGCGHAFYSEYIWVPPSTGHFTISVRAFGNGQWGEPGVVAVDVMDNIFAQSTPPGLGSVPTKWMSGRVKVAPKQNSNCREGGGEGYRILAVLMKGESAEAVALSEDGLYVKVIPPEADLQCWIAIGLLDIIEGDFKSLPFEGFPALPPEEPKPPVGAH